MKFRNLKLAHKQYIGFDFILLVMVIVSIYAINRMAILRDQIDEVSNNWLPRALAISDINKNTSDLRINQLQYAFAEDQAGKDAQAEMIYPLIDRINDNRNTYETLRESSEKSGLYSDEERQLYEAFDEKWDEYQEVSIDFFLLARNNKIPEALSVLNADGRDIFMAMSKSLEDLIEVNKKDAFNASKNAQKTYQDTKRVAIFLLITTIVLALVFTSVLIRYITVPVQELDKAAQTVADGNLDVTLPLRSKDEIGSLANSFNSMTHSLREATDRLKHQADELQQQNVALQEAQVELEEKSQRLEKQNTEIEEKNTDLEKQKMEIMKKNLDLHETMEQLRSTQQQLLMKEKMAALGDLVAGIAHEINNPIGTVTSSTDVTGRCLQKIEIVLEESKTLEELRKNSQLPKALRLIRDNVRVTLVAGERIATIVKSLKNFARLDEATYQVVDIHEGLESAITLLGNELRGRIEVERHYNELPKIGCYPSELNQVFMNVLRNASQAIGENGTIGISTNRNNGNVEIQISDNGKGIAAEKLDNIFDFSFTSSSDKRVKMTSGLTTAYNIIQKHHGDIIAESQLGEGTTITILLPVSHS